MGRVGRGVRRRGGGDISSKEVEEVVGWVGGAEKRGWGI